MAVPRNRSSNARTRSRRSHMAKKPKSLGACSNCGKKRMPHRICPHCGQYANRQVENASEA